MLRFYLLNSESEIINKSNGVYLIHNSWDDLFEYEITYDIYLIYSGKFKLGKVKIAKKNLQERTAVIPTVFDRLPEDFFSIGYSEEYYDNLKKFVDIREETLVRLNDIAFNLEIYESVKNDRVTRISILRNYTENTLKGILHRLAHGHARLTDYNLVYDINDWVNDRRISMSFNVFRNQNPSSNIHVLIGRNGIGKTTLLKDMVHALEESGKGNNTGQMNNYSDADFSNIVFVSFSAFDNPLFSDALLNNRETLPIKYKYVGLQNENDNTIKSKNSLTKDFLDASFFFYYDYSKMNLWQDTLKILSSDITFDNYNIASWITPENRENWKKEIIRNFQERSADDKWNEVYRLHSEQISEEFMKLSSGHKIILITLANLIDLVEEKTIVFIDEPEEHLHPPLVAAFIQALSHILIYRNGMGIISTHSPVVVQEVPKSCVWIINRYGNTIVPRRPECETFGENLGILTSEIFGYEVKKTGFHRLLEKALDENNGDYEKTIESFDYQLGMEAKSILRAYSYNSGD